MKIYNFDQIKKAIDINKDLDSLVNNQRQRLCPVDCVNFHKL